MTINLGRVIENFDGNFDRSEVAFTDARLKVEKHFFERACPTCAAPPLLSRLSPNPLLKGLVNELVGWICRRQPRHFDR